MFVFKKCHLTTVYNFNEIGNLFYFETNMLCKGSILTHTSLTRLGGFYVIIRTKPLFALGVYCVYVFLATSTRIYDCNELFPAGITVRTLRTLIAWGL